MNPLLRLIKRRYGLPAASQLDIDSAEAVDVHAQILRSNELLLRYYRMIYRYFAGYEAEVAHLNLPSLEIGSGAGFLKEFIPDVITSDVVGGPGIDRVEDACHLSFADNSLKAIYAFGVVHHVPDPLRCLAEIQRVLAPGGVFVCNEPSSTTLGYFMNKHFHHEPTDKDVAELPTGQREGGEGRLTEVNMAIPHILFRREAGRFSERFPQLRIERLKYHDFLRYPLSGGLSYRPFIPRWLYWTTDVAEWLTWPLMRWVGQEMLVTVRKVGGGA